MGRNARELKEAIKNIANKEVEGETKGQILENLNKQYVGVALTIGVVDASGDDIAGATVTLKKGAVVGSGDTVTANENGTYNYENGWNMIRGEYLKVKNSNEDPDKRSGTLFLEAVNNVYNNLINDNYSDEDDSYYDEEDDY